MSLAELKVSKNESKANFGVSAFMTFVHLVVFRILQKEDIVCLFIFLVILSEIFCFVCFLFSKKKTGKWSDNEFISIPAEYCLQILFDQM